MKAIALKVFGDGKQNYSEGEVFETSPEMFKKINSTPNGILAKEVKEEKSKKTREG
jgi:hypothetical protein